MRVEKWKLTWYIDYIFYVLSLRGWREVYYNFLANIILMYIKFQTEVYSISNFPSSEIYAIFFSDEYFPTKFSPDDIFSPDILGKRDKKKQAMLDNTFPVFLVGYSRHKNHVWFVRKDKELVKKRLRIPRWFKRFTSGLWLKPAERDQRWVTKNAQEVTPEKEAVIEVKRFK